MVSNDDSFALSAEVIGHPRADDHGKADASTSTSQSLSPSPELNGFLVAWKTEIQPKFVPLLSALASTPLATAILSCQIFSYLPVLLRNEQKLQAEDMCLLACSSLEEFHRQCFVDGVRLDLIGAGPMGKVWENGDVQVVQYPSNLPTTAYPMDRFPKQALANLGEVVFLPVYDGRINSSTPGIVAVVECILQRGAPTDMLVAKVIGVLGDIMESIGLSLYPPASKTQEEQSSMKDAAAGGGIERDGSFVRNGKAFNSMQRSTSHARFDMQL